MNKLLCMQAFVSVVQAKGFSNAARKSTLTKALLSKYVAQLENELGLRLLQRTTRHVSPTEAGRAYYERCIPLLEELEELESTVHDIQTEPSGELKISAPTSFAELHLMKVVSNFSKLYPKILITMELTDRMVDIVEEGVDLALRIGHLADSTLVASRISTIHTVAYASPEYLKQFGEPEVPEDLADHQCIIDTNFKENGRWTFSQGGKKTSINVHGSHIVNSAIGARELVIEHNGISLSPIFVVADEIKAGRLKIILRNYEIDTYALFAVYSHRRYLSAKTRLFINILKEYFSSISDWNKGAL